jgi:hypothetical protein
MNKRTIILISFLIPVLSIGISFTVIGLIKTDSLSLFIGLIFLIPIMILGYPSLNLFLDIIGITTQNEINEKQKWIS